MEANFSKSQANSDSKHDVMHLMSYFRCPKTLARGFSETAARSQIFPLADFSPSAWTRRLAYWKLQCWTRRPSKNFRNYWFCELRARIELNSLSRSATVFARVVWFLRESSEEKLEAFFLIDGEKA